MGLLKEGGIADVRNVIETLIGRNQLESKKPKIKLTQITRHFPHINI